MCIMTIIHLLIRLKPYYLDESGEHHEWNKPEEEKQALYNLISAGF